MRHGGQGLSESLLFLMAEKVEFFELLGVQKTAQNPPMKYTTLQERRFSTTPYVTIHYVCLYATKLEYFS